jgi:pyruvate-formate lyase
MRILMLGRGVIATIYGQALQHSGHHVDHLVRPGRAAEYGDTVQTDVIDAEVLKDAREHPEQYKTLSVRVSGCNARFITLNKEWQDMIIERTSGGTV